MALEIPQDDSSFPGEDDNDDDASEFEQNPSLFLLTGVDTSLDEIVLEDCLTKVLSSCDISNDERGDEDEDEDNFLPSIMVTLLETDYNDEKGVILFCIDRSLFVIGDSSEEDDLANDKANQDVLQRIRDYVASDEAKSSDPVWINSEATIEIVAEEEVEKVTEEEAYESWLKHNEADGGDNANVVADFQQEEEKKDATE